MTVLDGFAFVAIHANLLDCYKQQLEEFPEILKAEGSPDVQAFMRTFRQMEAVVEQYHHDLAQWERQTGKIGSPPEKESVREKLR